MRFPYLQVVEVCQVVGGLGKEEIAGQHSHLGAVSAVHCLGACREASTLQHEKTIHSSSTHSIREQIPLSVLEDTSQCQRIHNRAAVGWLCGSWRGERGLASPGVAVIHHIVMDQAGCVDHLCDLRQPPLLVCDVAAQVSGSRQDCTVVALGWGDEQMSHFQHR